MALDFNWSECRRPHSATPEENRFLETIIETLIWKVRLRDLNDDNLDEWLYRIKFYDEVHDTVPLLRQSRPGLRMKLKRWVGLKTNGYDETREQWVKTLIEQIEFKCKQG